MRIVAGEFRGRVLKTLPGRAVRPTSDRLRETLFNVLRNDVAGAVFIDCYAGSGAVGLEAASRGAAQVYLIEREPPAVGVMERNVAALGLSSHVEVVRGDVKAALRKLAARGVQADLCFADPPYADLQDALRVIAWLARGRLAEGRPAGPMLMNPEGLIILEHSRGDSTPPLAGSWRRMRLLEQGSSALSFYRPG